MGKPGLLDAAGYRKKRRFLILLALALILAAFSASLLGRYPAAGFTRIRTLGADPLALRIFLSLRLPRVIMAILLGISLSAAGAVFQLMFANPLVEPGFLGVSQGAAFGAALAIILWGGALVPLQITAAGFGLSGLLLSYLIGHRIRFGGWILRLILSGLAVSALFSAGIGLLKYTADPLTELPEITYWLLGGLSGVTWTKTVSVLPFTLPCLAVLVALRWKINLLAISDQTSFSLGLAPGRMRVFLILCAVLPVTAVISVCGVVQWIGLIVPHLSRILFGADARYSLPGALIMGGIVGLLCDTAARVSLPGEIPVGIVTALLGSVLFLLILSRKKVNYR